MFLNVLFIVLQLYNYATNNKKNMFGLDVTYDNIESFAWEIPKNHTKEKIASVWTIPDSLMPHIRKKERSETNKFVVRCGTKS